MNDGHKRQGQKHQNKAAFKIMFNPLALDTHKKVSYKGLCKRCAEQLQWKVKYNKYKRMTEPAKCNYCHQKNVFRTYMRACEACSESMKVCPKCLDPETEEQTQVKLNQLEQKKEQMSIERKMNEYIKTLRERSRRTVKRLLEKGTASWDNELNTYVDQEGNALLLQFRHGYGDGSKDSEGDHEEDIDQFGDGSDSDDQKGAESDDQDQKEEQEKQIKVKNKKQPSSKNTNSKPDTKAKNGTKIIQPKKLSKKENKIHDKEDKDQDEGNDSDDQVEPNNQNEPAKQNIGSTTLKQETGKQKQAEEGNNDDEDWVDEQQDQIDEQ